MNKINSFFNDLIAGHKLAPELVRRDFASRHAGSLFGVLWSFIQPLALMLVMWLVFELGFKQGQRVDGVPFSIWFFSGFIAWSFISEAILASSQAITQYSFLVKKVNFKLNILVPVRVYSSLYVHLVFVVLILVLAAALGLGPTKYWLQLPYFLILSSLLVSSMGWLLSAVSVFFRDLNQILVVAMQVAFWGTPVFWDPSRLPKNLSFLVDMNPFYYLVNGYRSAIALNQWAFFSHPSSAISFYISLFGFSFLGIVVFQRLRPSFADAI